MGEHIDLKSIDEGPFQMWTTRDTLVLKEQKCPPTWSNELESISTSSPEDKDMMLLKVSDLTKEDRESQLYDDFEHNRGQGNNARGVGAAGYGGAQNKVGNANPGQARHIKCYNCNGIGHIARNYTQPKRSQNSEYFKDKMLLMQAQENGVALDEEQLMFLTGGQENVVDEDVDEQPMHDLALNVDNVFQADDCDAFDSDVDEAPTTQTMFMANLSFADPVYDEASPSYDSDILSEVHDHDHYQDAVCEHHEVHEMHNDVQPNYVVDSHADYTSDSNIISYDQYVKDNAVLVIQSDVSSVPNDAYMMMFNDIYEQSTKCVSVTTLNNVSDNSLTAELATYKEQVELYERQAKFELTEIEQKIDEQLRIVITDRNRKEESLKRELHSVKLQLTSTFNHNKLMVEEVTSLKKDFKHKENKYLEEFLDMKALKEKNKVAIGYKNPLCLTRAQQLQPALYNGHEIIKTNHVPTIVHNLEDTLEITEITRKKMNDKMKDPECVKKKVKIAPHDYSKENYLATFTVQKQLTPEQIFWSNDLIKMKVEALKEQTTASRPIKALMVYPPNTPTTLVPRALPTKSQVKINIFALIQLFLEFEKTCKKRITSTGLIEGERGFKKTKECYLTKVIPFFKTLKEHFEGIQKALSKEIKEMKDIFEELEAEVDQNVVNRKHDEIERKNILIVNDNLIADCLSKDVFYIATNYERTVSRFTEMHEAHTIVQTRCLELEVELSKLRAKVKKDDLTELVKRFSNLEVNHLNLQLKYQNLKESFGNNPSPPARDTPDFDSVFVIEKMKASIQGKDNAIKKLRTQISQLKETRSEADQNEKVKQHYKELYDSIKITRAKHIEQTTALLTENENLKAQIHENLKCNTMESVKPRVLAPGRYAIDVEPIPPHNRNNREVHLHYLKHLKESVETLHDIVEEAKVERPLDRSLASASLYTKHSLELLEYVIGTCPKDFNQKDKNHAYTPFNKKKQVTLEDQCVTSNNITHKHVEQRNIQKTNVPVLPPTGVNSFTNVSGSQPRSNTKKNMISPAKSVNKKKVEEHTRTSKSSLRTMNRVDSSISSKCTCDLQGRHDEVLPNLLIVQSLQEQIMVMASSFEPLELRKSKRHTHKPKIENTNLEVLNTLHMDLCGPMQVKMINGKKYILVIVDDYSRFTWVKFFRSKDETLEVVIKFLMQIQVSLNKTVRYIRIDNGTEFVNKDLTEYYKRVDIFHQKTVPRTPRQNDVVKRRNCNLVEAARTMLIFSSFYGQKLLLLLSLWCSLLPSNDSEDLGKLQPTIDIGIFVGYAPSRKGYRIYNKRTRRIMETIHVQFNELTEKIAPIQLSTGPAPTFLTPGQISLGLLEPPRVERPVSPTLAVPVQVNSAGTPSSTTIDQDYTMADMNVPANDAPAEQAPAIFNLHKDLLRDALDITPTNDKNPFVAPPSIDTIIEYVNTLGYPCEFIALKATKVTKPKVSKVTKPAGDKAPKPTSSQPPKPTPAQTEPSKKDQSKKHKPVKETSEAPFPAKRAKAGKVTKKRMPKSSLQLVDEFVDEFVDEDVQGKGKEKVVDEQAAHDLLTLYTPKQKSPEAPEIHAGDHDEGQAGPNPGEQDEGQAGPNPVEQDEGQAGSNPGDAAESQPQLKFTTTAYPNVQKNLKLLTEDQLFIEKPHEEEHEKTNTESEVQSIVMVPILQDTSSVPPMTSPVIDLTVSHPVSTTIHVPLPTSTATVTATTTTTSLPLPPPQLQQSATDPILVRHIGELEQHMADLVQSNLALEERLDKHGSRLYKLENLNIPQQVSKAVDEIVTDVINWAMQAPLRARFNHKNLFDALQKSLERDYSNQLLADLDEARKKKRKRRSTLQQGNRAPSSSKTATSTHQSMAWTTSDTRYESTGFTAIQETSPLDDLMHDDSILDEHVHLSDNEDSRNDHLPKDNVRKDWWKPHPEKERLATPKPTWTIPSSNVSDVKNNWASALVSTHETPTVLTQANFKGQAYEVVKAFYPDVIQLQFQMEECHKMLTDQVDWTNLEGYQVRVNVNRPLPLSGPPAEFQEHTIAEKDFKNLYPSDFKDLNLLLLQGHLDHLHGSDKLMLSTAVKLWTRNLIMRFNEIYKFSDGSLTRILEALDYKLKEFMVKRLNPGMNTRFWTQKDVTRSKEFIAAIERRPKTRRIYQNLECFVGGRVRDIDYRLLQRT
ncbi:retrovirus-related pol polyprotein from transposon TNT 1-94 [Tanacetum coccineum]|uniref:Retrovirus-related pol polyprotein from transposon TNT 1-94 n=1 Tax=Tanacetum coccineum TaxID=301880 RepID=A0ABQ4YR30_9ASTR